MAHQAQMFVKGKMQGDIKGDSLLTTKDKKDSFDVLSLEHDVTLPHEARTGQVSGKRVHHPMVAEIRIGDATPKFFKALTTGESLEVVFKFFRHDQEGAEKLYLTTKLEKAFLTSIKTEVPDVLSEQGTKVGNTHLLSFIYSRITWTAEGGVEHIDSWAEHT